jgi:WD40 repeat protein
MALDRYRSWDLHNPEQYHALRLQTYSAPLSEALANQDWIKATNQYLELLRQSPQDADTDSLLIDYPILRRLLAERATNAWANFNFDEQQLPLSLGTMYTSDISALDFSAGGMRRVFGSTDGLLHFVPLSQSSNAISLQSGFSFVTNVVIEPRGQWVAAAGSSSEVRVWNFETGQPLVELRGHTDWVLTLAVSPNGQWLASGGDDGQIHIRSTVDWNAEPTVISLGGRVSALQFSPDNQTLAVGFADGAVKLVNMQTQQVNAQMAAGAYVREIVFQPSGNVFMTISNTTTVQVWSTDGSLLHTFEEHSDWVRSGAFSADNRLAFTLSGDGMLLIWDVSTGDVMNAVAVVVDESSRVRLTGDATQIVVTGASGRYALLTVQQAIIETATGENR